jgi:hypothetical protein
MIYAVQISMKYFSYSIRLYWNTPYSWDSSVGIGTGYELDGRGLIPGKGMIFLHNVHTGAAIHPAPYPMGTGVSFFGGKGAVVWSWSHA